jgi:hypothetical protein
MSTLFPSGASKTPARNRGCLKAILVALVWIGVAVVAYLLYRGMFGGGNGSDVNGDPATENKIPATAPLMTNRSPSDTGPVDASRAVTEIRRRSADLPRGGGRV